MCPGGNTNVRGTGGQQCSLVSARLRTVGNAASDALFCKALPQPQRSTQAVPPTGPHCFSRQGSKIGKFVCINVALFFLQESVQAEFCVCSYCESVGGGKGSVVTL